MYLLQHWTMLGCIARASLFWPAAALLGISPVNTVLWKYLYKFMHCSFNENYRIVETPKYPHTKEWLNQLLYGHWVEYYATVKKKKPAALFTIGKTWNQSKCPLTHKWKYKCDVYYSEYTEYYYSEYYSAFKRKENLQYAKTWMNLEDIILSGINQSQKDKCHVIPLTWSTWSNHI